MARYAFKDKRAELYRLKQRKPDGLGGLTEESFELKGPFWCAAEETAENIIRTTTKDHVRVEDGTYTFIFNNEVDVEQFDLIKYRNKWYEVTRVSTVGDYNTEKTVRAELKARYTPVIYTPEGTAENGD